jgi:signal transduction histidine kinase
MHDEAIRMAELVNNLLEAARLHSGQTQWHWGDVKLSRVCDEALNVVRPLINHAAVELRWHMDPANLSMRGDAEALCRMIINFISNAAKHTTQGSITLDATSLVRDGRPWVVMRFIDTGTGIPPTMIAKLGKAFVLNDGSIGSDYAKGVGLGLSICRGIVAAHAGEIYIESQPDRGCTFTVILPADGSGPIEASDVAIQSVAA